MSQCVQAVNPQGFCPDLQSVGMVGSLFGGICNPDVNKALSEHAACLSSESSKADATRCFEPMRAQYQVAESTGDVCTVGQMLLGFSECRHEHVMANCPDAVQPYMSLVDALSQVIRMCMPAPPVGPPVADPVPVPAGQILPTLPEGSCSSEQQAKFLTCYNDLAQQSTIMVETYTWWGPRNQACDTYETFNACAQDVLHCATDAAQLYALDTFAIHCNNLTRQVGAPLEGCAAQASASIESEFNIGKCVGNFSQKLYAITGLVQSTNDPNVGCAALNEHAVYQTCIFQAMAQFCGARLPSFVEVNGKLLAELKGRHKCDAISPGVLPAGVITEPIVDVEPSVQPQPQPLPREFFYLFFRLRTI